jgi:hypothetical protein
MTDEEFEAEAEALCADLDSTLHAFIRSRGDAVRADVIAHAIWHALEKFLSMSPDHETCLLGITVMREQLQLLYDEVERRRVQPEAGSQ